LFTGLRQRVFKLTSVSTNTHHRASRTCYSL